MTLEPQPIETRGRTRTTGDQRWDAAIHIADRVAAEHPHELDDTMPRLAGRLLGKDPAVQAELTDLLGYFFGPIGRNTIKGELS
jgi:hypothetical protein